MFILHTQPFHFSRFETVYEGRITEGKLRQALKTVGLDNSSSIDSLPYEVYLRLSHTYMPLLATINNNWMKQGSIPRPFTSSTVNLLRKGKHGGDRINHFRLLTMLNIDLKILAKILADCFQTE